MKSELIKISRLKNNSGQVEGLPANPRFIKDDKYQLLKKSIQEDPDMMELREVIAYDNGDELVVIAGNMRLRACKELGYKEVPTKILPADTDVEKLKRVTIKDNAGFGEHDWDILGNLWSDEPLADWGMDLPEDWLQDEPEIEEDEAPEVSDEPPVSKLGEIYQLGRHRVMCADSTVKENVEMLMNGEKADMVFTDPPYGIAIVGKNGKVGADKLAKNQVYSDVIGDETTDTAQAHYEAVKGLSDKQIIWGGNYFTNFLPFSPGWIIWDKRGDMNSNNFADGEMAWCSYPTRVRIYKQVWNGMIREGESDKRVHPTQKPIDTLARILKDHTEDNDNVLDGFLGSGSTLIACEQTDRTCFGLELDPKYIDVVRRRYHKFVTGSEEGWADATPAI